MLFSFVNSVCILCLLVTQCVFASACSKLHVLSEKYQCISREGRIQRAARKQNDVIYENVFLLHFTEMNVIILFFKQPKKDNRWPRAGVQQFDFPFFSFIFVKVKSISNWIGWKRQTENNSFSEAKGEHNVNWKLPKKNKYWKTKSRRRSKHTHIRDDRALIVSLMFSDSQSRQQSSWQSMQQQQQIPLDSTLFIHFVTTKAHEYLISDAIFSFSPFAWLLFRQKLRNANFYFCKNREKCEV